MMEHVLWFVAGASVVVWLVFLTIIRIRLPAMIVAVPHPHGKCPKDPEPLALQRAGVDRHVRVDIGTDHDLSVLLIEPNGPVRGTVLGIHGVHNDALAIANFGRRAAAEHGCRVILPDLPGHGHSAGHFRTFGAHESRALSILLDQLVSDLDTPIVAVGFSYGGAVCCQLAARDARIHAVAPIAPFSDLFHAVRDRLPSVLPWGGLAALVPSLLLRWSIASACHRAGFTEIDADASRAVSGSPQTQFLFVHGDADRVLPVRHTERLADAARRAGTRFETYVEAGAGHGEIFESARAQQTVLDWVARQTREEPGGSAPSNDTQLEKAR